MASFVFPGQLDPHVFPTVAGRDYAVIAETSWLSAQVWSCDLATVDADLAVLAERIAAGQAWLASHVATDPGWQHARQLLIELEHAEVDCQITRRSWSYACWLNCCEVYAAIQHLQDRTWWRADGTGFSPEHPLVVWSQLRGDERSPGAWPSNPNESVIEGRLASVPTWQMVELAERIANGR